MNRRSEHSIILNDFCRDAKKTRKDLIVTAIDFTKAFGSVPHVITSMLKQLNFPIWMKAIFEDMYEDVKSTIGSKGNQTRPITWRKGVKKGCPLSRLLFNFCVEPLLQAIKRNDEIHGAYVDVEAREGRVKFDLQVYADDVVFISESEDRISQMLQVLDEYTR
jgi:hypothetical protein